MSTEFVVFGVAASILVKAIVNLAKELGLGGKWPLVLAIVVGIVLAAGMQLSEMYPAFALWFRVVVTGSIAGLTASELYQAEKARDAK